ncbi:hypothetical protein G6L37_05320 [Agrobacterium rubi]|nr:hypothetical protein [Agrobacterium rubi]NTF24777.1 hypothetical protein [Agrobacterium rubi]
MSTKIYNGFKLREHDMARIHQILMDWRTELRLLHQQAASRFIAEIATNMIDEETLEPGCHKGETPFTKGLSLLWDMQAEVKKTQRRNPVVDFEFCISLLPFEGGIYGIAYTEQHAWRDLWMSKPFVEDFAYWDNTDKPDEVSEADWDERGRVWDAILASAILTAPSMAGFSADCTHETLFPEIGGVMEMVPSFEDRSSRRAKFNVVGAEIDRLRRQEIERNPASTRMFAIEGMDWFQSDAGRAVFQAEKDRLRSILHADLTKEMLIGVL